MTYSALRVCSQKLDQQPKDKILKRCMRVELHFHMSFVHPVQLPKGGTGEAKSKME